MRDDEMVIGKGQGQLMLQIIRVFRERIDLAAHPPRVLTHRQVVALHAIGVDGETNGRSMQGRLDLRRSAVDNTGRDFDHAPILALFDHDGIPSASPVGVHAEVSESVPGFRCVAVAPTPHRPPKAHRHSVATRHW